MSDPTTNDPATNNRATDYAIEPLTVLVDGQRMKTMAAILRDPYPVHWDPDAVEALGMGREPINQGPLNVSYVANMLMAWAGDDSIRRLTVKFHDRVHAGDTLTASATVEAELEGDDVSVPGERHVRCAVELMRGTEPIMSGSAVVAIDF